MRVRTPAIVYNFVLNTVWGLKENSHRTLLSGMSVPGIEVPKVKHCYPKLYGDWRRGEGSPPQDNAKAHPYELYVWCDVVSFFGIISIFIINYTYNETEMKQT